MEKNVEFGHAGSLTLISILRKSYWIIKTRKYQDLRLRFKDAYLGQLKDFSRIRKEPFINEGDIVLVGDTNTKKFNWPLAKIRKIFPGKDGRIQIVEVKTRNGKLLRPIQRLYPVEVGNTSRRLSPIVEPQYDPGGFSPEGAIIISVPDHEIPREPIALCSRFWRLLKPPERLSL